MKWLRRIQNYKHARKLGIKLSDPKIVDAPLKILVESPAVIGKVVIMPAKGTSSNTIYIGAHSYIRSGELHNVRSIGRFCSIGRNVVLGQTRHNHPIDWISTSHQLCADHLSVANPTIIGNDVWIGDGVLILDGVTVGDGAIVGARSVVTKDVKPYEIVAGNPARSIRFRFEDKICNRLQHSQWWNYPFNELKKLDYKNPLTFLNQLNNLIETAEYQVVTLGYGKIRTK